MRAAGEDDVDAASWKRRKKIMIFYTHKKRKQVDGRIVFGMTMAALFMTVFLSHYGFSAGPGQETFSSPAEAFKAMVNALQDNNPNELTAIFGRDKKELFADDEGNGQDGREWFLNAYEKKNRVEIMGGNKAVLYVGNDDWPWPVPVVRVGEKWRFDSPGGEEEILARRIGQNEISAVQVCLAYVDAQQEYAQNHRVSGLPEYAQRFTSEPGQDDALCSGSEENDQAYPMGPLITGACRVEAGQTQPESDVEPYYGYYYKILTKQGPDAFGGAYDYIVKGRMVGGFALVAYPAVYKSTGVMTFIVNQDDVVYEKDLGEGTIKTAEAMTTFNPDPSWAEVD